MHQALVVATIVASMAAPGMADPRSGAHTVTTAAIHIDWASPPNANDLQRFYPPKASEHGVSGGSRIQCAVKPDGSLVDCEVLEETPTGMGFGPAAIEASRLFRMQPYRAALANGELPRVLIPIRWVVAPKPKSAPGPAHRSPSVTVLLLAILTIGGILLSSICALRSRWYARLSVRGKSRVGGLITGVIALSVGVAVGQFQRAALAEAAGTSAAAILFLGQSFWDERSRWWFQPFMAAAVVAHVITVVSAPWPVHHHPSKGDALFLLADLAFWVGLGLLIKRLTEKPGEPRPAA